MRMLLTDFLKEGISSLERLYSTAESRSMMLMLCEAKIGTKSYTHIVEPEYQISAAQEALLRENLERLSKGEPIQYVIGKAEFCGFEFKVGPDVLIPRPETELMCREAISICSRISRMRGAYGKKAAPVKVLDLCTGSGCIAWTVALSVPGVVVTGVDISEGALKIASSQNFQSVLKETGAVSPTFKKADILDRDTEFTDEKYDVIISNPPYIMESEKPLLRANVLEFEPHLALFVPDEDPLVFYRAIADWSERFLAPEGKGLTEINEVLGKETFTVFKEAGFVNLDIVKDFYDKNRFIFYSKPKSQ